MVIGRGRSGARALLECDQPTRHLQGALPRVLLDVSLAQEYVCMPEASGLVVDGARESM